MGVTTQSSEVTSNEQETELREKEFEGSKILKNM